MRTEKREVFIADDGKSFDTVEACHEHERAMAANARRVENLKVYTVSHAFEATEGRGYFGLTYIVTDADMMPVLAYCFDRYGKPLQPWYGDGFFEAWIIRPQTYDAAEAIRRSKSRSGTLNGGKSDLVFLSAKAIKHPELPARAFPWPPASPVHPQGS